MNANTLLQSDRLWRPIALVSVLAILILGIVVALTRNVQPNVMTAQSLLQQDVPPTKVVPESKMTPDNRQDFRTISDVSVFDLRGWRIIGSKSKPQITSYTNYMRLRKAKKVDTFTMRYWSEGKYSLRCLTQGCDLEVTPGVMQNGRPGTMYAINIHIGDIPVGTDFLSIVDATCVDGFPNPETEWVAIGTQSDVGLQDELSMIILFPLDKPSSGLQRTVALEGSAKGHYGGQATYYVSPDNSYVYWSIKSIKPNGDYYLQWNW